MFRRSFDSFLEKDPSKSELYPYIYSISLKGLETVAKKKVTTEPVKCSQCGAVLTNIKLIQQDKKIGTYFKCEYCNAVNVIDKYSLVETLPDDIDFIVEDILPKESKKEAITKVSVTEGELYISIIDISGSMSGAKIESVKKSLVQTIKDFKVNSPATKYVLIAFESSVYYYLRHDQTPKNFSGDLLFNLAGMKTELQKYLKSVKLGSVGEFADGWVRTVQNLRSMDMTALGPALFFGIESFELFNSPGGRITLLTDGLANQGIGNLSGTGVSPEKFYEEMANLCNQNKIIVDVVGVSVPGDNNEMGLQILGKLTDKTGGKLYLISSQEMEAIFSELMQTNYIGKDVKIKVITPPTITIKNITGAYSSKGAVKESELNLGAITSERELFVELDSPKKIKEKVMEEIPIQLQVEFKDKDGRKRLRVINDRVKMSKDENEFKAKYDQKLNAMMNIQAAGTEYYAGKADASKERLQILKENILNEMTSLKKNMKGEFEEKAFSDGADFLADELDEIDADEKQVQNAPAQSFMAAKGQSRARMSQDEKKLKMEKKK